MAGTFTLALCNEALADRDFPAAMDTAAAMGFEAVEIAPFTLAKDVRTISTATRNVLRRAVESAGLEVAGLHWLLAKTEGFHVANPDAEVRQRTLEYLGALARFCADLGGRVMVFGSPAQRSLPPGVARGDALKSAAGLFAGAAESAAECGVVICLEPLRKTDTDMWTSASEALEFVEAVGHPNFQLMLDTRALHGEDRPAPETIGQMAGRFRHFHLNDASGRCPGLGHTDFGPVFAALKEAAYSGYVSVEPLEYVHDPESDLRASVAYLKRIMALAAS